MAMGIPNAVLDPLQSILVFNRRKIYIDNIVFRMHYTWTVLILLTFSLLVSSKLYIGQPINCMGSEEIKAIANEYCFIHSTFTRGKFEKGKWTYEPVKENEIEPGVHPSIKGEELVYHTYYQWIWCILLIQAAFFYFPHWCWEKIEGGRIMMLVGNLNLPMQPDGSKEKQRKKVLWYFDPNRGYHTGYALYHALLEVVNLIHIFAEICITDYFLNYEFSKYGFKLFTLTDKKPYNRDDALTRVFPTVTSCRLQTGGVAFGKNQFDLLCVLPINIVNEKIYIFLWFWFLLVAISSVISIIYRLVTVFSPRFRKYLLLRRARFVGEDTVGTFSKDCKYGDWFLIHKLSENMDEVAFGDLLKEIAEAFSKGGTPKHLHSKEHRPSIVIDIPSDDHDHAPFLAKLLEKMI